MSETQTKLAVDASGAAKMLGISTRTLYELRTRRGLPYVLLDRKYLYQVSDLKEWLKRNRKQDRAA
jgi:excisionase family DNA binding protein